MGEYFRCLQRGLASSQMGSSTNARPGKWGRVRAKGIHVQRKYLAARARSWHSLHSANVRPGKYATGSAGLMISGEPGGPPLSPVPGYNPVSSNRNEYVEIKTG